MSKPQGCTCKGIVLAHIGTCRLHRAAPDLAAALEKAAALFAKDHAIDHFNWGASGLTAENVRELNETPLAIRAALKKAGR